jgi:hypothetical protein
MTPDTARDYTFTPAVSGSQQAQVSSQVDRGLEEPGEVHEGYLRPTGSAGQKLALHVVVEVRVPLQPFSRRLLRSLQGKVTLGVPL